VSYGDMPNAGGDGIYQGVSFYGLYQRAIGIFKHPNELPGALAATQHQAYY
jgi:hypothetical protein